MTDPRYEEYRKRKRREDTVMMAKRMFILQVGHHGGLWLIDESEHTSQHEAFRNMSRQALSAAEAFMAESEKLLAEGDPK